MDTSRTQAEFIVDEEQNGKLLKELERHQPPPPPKTYDDFIRMSRYVMLVLLLSEFMLLSSSGHMIFMVYGGAAPKVFCRVGNATVDACKVNRTVVCEDEPYLEYEFLSVNVEWNYICEKGRWVKSCVSVEMLGILFGSLLFGHLSDRHGRRKVLIVAFVMTTILTLATSFATDLVMFTALRTALGFFSGGQLVVYHVFKMENIPKRHRFWISTIIAWAPNMIILNILAWATQEWRLLLQVLFLAALPAAGLLYLVSESPRWLIQRGRIEEARRIMHRIQRIDMGRRWRNIELEQMMDEEYVKFVERTQKRQARNYTVRHLFHTRQLSVATIVLCSGIFITSFISYGLAFNLEKLAGSLYVNFFLMSILRWSMNGITGVMDFYVPWLGRKIVHLSAQGPVCVCAAVMAVVYHYELDYPLVTRICTLTALVCTSQVFISKSITAMEVYPTVIRNTAISIQSTCSRVGTILAPQLFFLSPYRIVPYIVMTVLSAIDTWNFQVFLPETKGRPLPDELPPKEPLFGRKRIEREMEPIIPSKII